MAKEPKKTPPAAPKSNVAGAVGGGNFKSTYAGAPQGGTPQGQAPSGTWSEQYLAKHGPQGAVSDEAKAQMAKSSPTLPNWQAEESAKWGPSRGAGDYGKMVLDKPLLGTYPVSPREAAFGRDLFGKLRNPFIPAPAGPSRMDDVLRWERNPAYQKAFEERKQRWEEKAATVGVKQIEARRAALEAYRAATPQERMMLAPELRAQFDSEILAEKAAQTGAVAQSAAVRKMDQARQASTRVRANDMSEKAESISKANQAALQLWANKPSMPPPIDRPSPIRGGGFFVDPDYRRLLQDKAQKLNAWTSAAATVEAQKRKLLNRAVSEPDEE